MINEPEETEEEAFGRRNTKSADNYLGDDAENLGESIANSCLPQQTLHFSGRVPSSPDFPPRPTDFEGYEDAQIPSATTTSRSNSPGNVGINPNRNCYSSNDMNREFATCFRIDDTERRARASSQASTRLTVCLVQGVSVRP